MSYHIRGGLGMQVLSLFVRMAESLENNEEVKKSITLNFGNYVDPRIKEEDANVDFLSKIFPNAFLNIETQIGTEKTKVYNIQAARNVKKHIVEIRRLLKSQFWIASHTPTNYTFIHLRQRDRQLLEPEVLLNYGAQRDLGFIYFSDDDVEGQIVPRKKNALYDWYEIIYNSNITGTFSTYTLSAAILNPKLQLLLFPKEDCIPGIISDSDWEGLEEYVRLFDNINWIDNDKTGSLKI
jgi:hypothetical protein